MSYSFQLRVDFSSVTLRKIYLPYLWSIPTSTTSFLVFFIKLNQIDSIPNGFSFNIINHIYKPLSHWISSHYTEYITSYYSGIEWLSYKWEPSLCWKG